MLIVDNNELKKIFIEKFNLNKYFSKNLFDDLKLIKYLSGDYICRNGDSASSLMFLVQGKCRISIHRENGKSLLLRFGHPPFIIADLEMTLGNTYDCDVQCIEDTYCISMSFKKIQLHCSNDPLFWREISRGLAKKMHISSMSNSINLLYPLENRLASYLISTSKYNENLHETIDMATSKLTDIADLLGTSYRHLARTLNTLQKRGVISRKGKAIIIEDYPALLELSGDIYV